MEPDFSRKDSIYWHKDVIATNGTKLMEEE